jgi:hypothetical protein
VRLIAACALRALELCGILPVDHQTMNSGMNAALA